MSRTRARRRHAAASRRRPWPRRLRRHARAPRAARARSLRNCAARWFASLRARLHPLALVVFRRAFDPGRSEIAFSRDAFAAVSRENAPARGAIMFAIMFAFCCCCCSLASFLADHGVRGGQEVEAALELGDLSGGGGGDVLARPRDVRVVVVLQKVPSAPLCLTALSSGNVPPSCPATVMRYRRGCKPFLACVSVDGDHRRESR